jgi:hypothetical protein
MKTVATRTVWICLHPWYLDRLQRPHRQHLRLQILPHHRRIDGNRRLVHLPHSSHSNITSKWHHLEVVAAAKMSGIHRILDMIADM